MNIGTRAVIQPWQCIMSGVQPSLHTVSITPFAKNMARESLSGKKVPFSSLFAFEKVLTVNKVDLHPHCLKRCHFDDKRVVAVFYDDILP